MVRDLKLTEEEYSEEIYKKVKEFIKEEFNLGDIEVVDLREHGKDENIEAFLIEKGEREFMQLDILNYDGDKIEVAIWEGSQFLREDVIEL